MPVSSLQDLAMFVLTDISNKHVVITHGLLPSGQAQLILPAVQIDLTGTERIIDTFAIRHAMLEHGNVSSEERRGQIAIIPSDFDKVAEILMNPDKMEFLKKNKLDQNVFIYTKRLDALYFVSEAVRISRKKGNRLVFQTMYKRK